MEIFTNLVTFFDPQLIKEVLKAKSGTSTKDSNHILTIYLGQPDFKNKQNKTGKELKFTFVLQWERLRLISWLWCFTSYSNTYAPWTSVYLLNGNYKMYISGRAVNIIYYTICTTIIVGALWKLNLIIYLKKYVKCVVPFNICVNSIFQSILQSSISL